MDLASGVSAGTEPSQGDAHEHEIELPAGLGVCSERAHANHPRAHPVRPQRTIASAAPPPGTHRRTTGVFVRALAAGAAMVHDGDVSRIERLFALVAELRAAAPEPLRAQELALRLGVGERTVRRDIAALVRGGLPVRTRLGDAGAYALARAAPATMDGRTHGKAEGAMGDDTDDEGGGADTTDRTGDDDRSNVRAIDFGRTAARDDTGDDDALAADAADADAAAAVSGPVRRTIDAAVRARRVVRIDYRDQSGERTTRDVEPHGLVVAPQGDYLAGWCRMRDAPRLFRLDRVNAAYLTAGEAGQRDLNELLAVLRVPGRPPSPAGGGPGRGTVRPRVWTLDRIRHTRGRLDTVTQARTGEEGAARLRALLCHLAEWCRWQVAAVRAVATGGDLVFEGRRPPFPAEFDGSLPYDARERMIQDAMATRSLPEVAGDLEAVLTGAAQWVAGSEDALWSAQIRDPAARNRSRPLADLVAGWWSPISHVEWHLDRWTDGTRRDGPAILVTRCPLRG